MFQKDVAVLIGVDTNTITNWEKNRTRPPLRFMPRITKVLGYETPAPKPVTLGETIKCHRYLKRISQKELARSIGIDPTTLSRLQRNSGRCFASVLRKVAAFLNTETED